ALDLFRLKLDHLARAQIDEVVVMAVGHLLIASAPVAEVMPLDDPCILEQLHGSINRRDRDAIVYCGTAPIELLNVRMIIGRRQYACDHSALLGHAHALVAASSFDVSGLRRVHDASPSDRNITAGSWNPLGLRQRR